MLASSSRPKFDKERSQTTTASRGSPPPPERKRETHTEANRETETNREGEGPTGINSRPQSHILHSPFGFSLSTRTVPTQPNLQRYPATVKAGQYTCPILILSCHTLYQSVHHSLIHSFTRSLTHSHTQNPKALYRAQHKGTFKSHSLCVSVFRSNLVSLHRCLSLALTLSPLVSCLSLLLFLSPSHYEQSLFHLCSGTAANVSMHTLPRDTALRQEWVNVIFASEVPENVNQHLRLCTAHLSSDCIENQAKYNAGFASKLLLTPGAVPALLNPASDIQQKLPTFTREVGCQTDPPKRRTVSTQLGTHTLQHDRVKSQATQVNVATVSIGVGSNAISPLVLPILTSTPEKHGTADSPPPNGPV
ncbi:hypothetical protein ANANG_G00160830 [Anguilla anguilla]|uniref:THAP-type domain-containing protein n=1 Tax=Anguilla anguilla TaxID=7936 RepID=A0A9D3RYV4_ANGAN|nr:hypothetical protein ANANG_G00160830 [Anguilla anguilla]